MRGREGCGERAVAVGGRVGTGWESTPHQPSLGLVSPHCRVAGDPWRPLSSSDGIGPRFHPWPRPCCLVAAGAQGLCLQLIFSSLLVSIVGIQPTPRSSSLAQGVVASGQQRAELEMASFQEAQMGPHRELQVRLRAL